MTAVSGTARKDESRRPHELRMSWHPRCADIDPAAWRRLFRPPALGLFWFKALEAGTGEQFEFWYGQIRSGVATVGIVPAFLFDLPLEIILPQGERRLLDWFARGPFRRARHIRTFFVGNVAGEEGAVGLDEGVKREDAYPFIHDAARSMANELGASLLVWKDFPDADAIVLDGLIRSRSVSRIPSYPGTVVPVLESGYAAFLAGQKSSHRRKIQKKFALGEASVPVSTRIVAHPDAAELSTLFQLFQQTYARGVTKFEALTPGFFQAIAAAEESTFIVLSDQSTGRPVAFMVLLELGPRVINQFIGIDYTRGNRAFLTFRLFAKAYDWAAQRGASTLWSGQTGYAAKLELGHQLVPLWNYCHHANRLMNWVLSRVASRIRVESLDDQLRIHLEAHTRSLPKT
jgi:GNAT acetyltransferase-like protein